MDINKRMFEQMEQKNIKMSDLAKHLNINKTVVSSWKNRGTNPPAEYIVQICELLNMSIEFLITGKEYQGWSREEQNLIDAYRKATPAMQEAARKILDVGEPEEERSSGFRTG
ncbi:helix-turn-helix domain-containing protein [Clostridium transplantifaecale]|uniref:helix-turn-helix domain-containing protein n=1 Tax=Clostridium transplantifaecale TaxID=2479838 RepID=UPI000F62F8C2|nr:helix-turn-helix domain-containing protein [Clostridium transplantifaecale]